MMLHRLDRQMEARHMADLTRPQPAAIDDLFSVDLALRGADIPAAIRALGNGGDRCVSEILRTMNARRLGKGVGRAGRIEIAILIIPQRGIVMFGVNQRMPGGKLLGADELLLQAHIARLGALTFQVIIPFAR